MKHVIGIYTVIIEPDVYRDLITITNEETGEIFQDIINSKVAESILFMDAKIIEKKSKCKLKFDNITITISKVITGFK